MDLLKPVCTGQESNHLIYCVQESQNLFNARMSSVRMNAFKIEILIIEYQFHQDWNEK